MPVAPSWAFSLLTLCSYFFCKDIAVILSFKEGIRKLVLVDNAILHSLTLYLDMYLLMCLDFK